MKNLKDRLIEFTPDFARISQSAEALLNRFELWQQTECQRLNITVDTHNEILEVCRKFELAGLGWPYDTVTSIITPPRMPDFSEAFEQISLKDRGE